MRRLAAGPLLGLALASSAALAGPATAQADIPGCPPARPVAEVLASAPVAFVGTVVTVTDEAREATVQVTRIWKGGPLPRTVTVRGNVATQAKVHTAQDTTYAQGAQYLFLPTGGSSPAFTETACSSTAAFDNDLAALAPPGGGDLPTGVTSTATIPEVERSESATRYLPLAIGGVGSLLLAGMLVVARRRGRLVHRP